MHYRRAHKILKTTHSPNLSATVLSFALGALFAATAGAREVLPRPEHPFGGKIGRTYMNSTPDWSPAAPVLPRADAPNIVVIVLDDVGFGHLGSYGGSRRKR